MESSKVIDLETFVPRGEVDPVYFNSPYYLYPDGQMALEAIRVIGAAMAEAGVVGIGRLTLSRREWMVMVEPRDTGMVLITLRAADEVRAPQFAKGDGAIDAEMLAIARAIIEQRTGKFDPSRLRDRYQEALRELIEAKMKGVAIEPRAVSTPAPVIDLMAALKRSPAQEAPAAKVARAKKGTKAARDRPPEGVASAPVWRQEKEGTAGDTTSRSRREASQERLTTAIRSEDLQSPARSAPAEPNSSAIACPRNLKVAREGRYMLRIDQAKSYGIRQTCPTPYFPTYRSTRLRTSFRWR